jgi:hypothetical protein
MTVDNLQGRIALLVLYDVSDEIKLEELQRLIGGKPLAPTFKHPAPEYVRFERPPVIEPLDPISLPTGEHFTASVQYYDYGVVSVLLHYQFSGSWRQLETLAGSWISGNVFDVLSRKIVERKVEVIAPAMDKRYDHWLSEDYCIVHLHTIPDVADAAALLRKHGGDISQIVRGETSPLAESERNEILQAHMSYYPNDLVVIGWNAAFLYDTETGAETTVRLLEYANSQLLQFRHYDDLLTRELRDVYRFLERRRGRIAGWRMRPAATRLHTVMLDVTELTERTNNALKFVGDMFSARLYKLGAARIGVNDYQVLVQEKLRAADDLYDFMIEQFHQARGFLLEFIVVLILIIELFFLFRGQKP